MHDHKRKLKRTLRTNDEVNNYIEIHELKNKFKRTVRTTDEVNNYIDMHDWTNKLKLIELEIVRVMQRDPRLKS